MFRKTRNIFSQHPKRVSHEILENFVRKKDECQPYLRRFVVPGGYGLGAGPRFHLQAANVHTGGDGAARAAGRTARALHAAALTEGQRVEAVAVALTAAVCEGKALVPLLVVPELVQVGVAGPNDLGQAADVLGLEAGRLAGLSRQEAVAVPFLSAVYKFLHS